MKQKEIEGGTCLYGHSDIFIHCNESDRPADEGMWTQWEEIGYCAATDFYKQKIRNCYLNDTSNPFCSGRWLEVNMK